MIEHSTHRPGPVGGMLDHRGATEKIRRWVRGNGLGVRECERPGEVLTLVFKDVGRGTVGPVTD